MKLGTIYKATKGGKVQEWTIEIEENKYRTTSGQTDGKKNTNEWTVVYGKNVGKANGTTDNEQALKEAIAKRTKKLESGYFEDITKIHQQQYFEPMLAAKWEDYKDKLQYPIFSQPKLDGIRCILTKEGMFSRNGKPIVSAPHIFESMKHLFDVNPNLTFDGELYADKFANDFNKIVSLVRKSKPTQSDLDACKNVIKYHIYDLPSTNGTFIERMEELKTIELSDDCVLVVTDTVNSEKEVMELYGKYVDEEYEGQMLRTNGLYENKRSKTLLKHKTFVDDEYTILDICEGEGNRTGTCGYMVFETKEGKSFKSSVKGTFEYTADVLKNKDSLIGKEATIKYFNLTPDGIPRFPYVIKINRNEYE
jgi:ATP-dependent DNA ligase